MLTLHKQPSAPTVTRSRKYDTSGLIEGTSFTDEELVRPNAEQIAECTVRTSNAFNLVIADAFAVGGNVKLSKKVDTASVYVRYTPANTAMAGSTGSQERIIRVQEIAQDPLDPARFKLQKAPKNIRDAPVPIMHDRARPPTQEEIDNAKVPSMVSIWGSNSKGHIIELDKRVALDGRNLSETIIGDKHADLVESLFVAEKVSRANVEARTRMLRRLEEKKREEENQMLQLQAMKDRQALAELDSGELTKEEEDRMAERDALVREMDQKMRQDNRKMAQEMALRRERQMEREKTRDISERVALGATVKGGGARFDERLYEKESGGSTAGFVNEDNHYDSDLFSAQRSIYRATDQKNTVDVYVGGIDDEHTRNRGLGADQNTAKNTGPVQFVKSKDVDTGTTMSGLYTNEDLHREHEREKMRARDRSNSPDPKRARRN